MEKTEGYPEGKTRSGIGASLERAYAFLRKGDVLAAQSELESALKLDFDDSTVMYALKCSGFWVDRAEKAREIEDPYGRGEYLLGQWKPFAAYESRLEGRDDDAAFAFRHYAFGIALSCFLAVRSDGAARGGDTENREADLSLRIGRCHKGRGEFEAAIENLEEAMKARREDPEIVAELADAYAMVNEIRTAKALFREAFRLDPQRIDLCGMESFLLKSVIERVRGMGYEGRELAEWIPVHATLLGVFNVKRELRPVESGKLRQSIYQLENEIKEPDADRSVLVPRLLNCYFWLVDHLVAVREARSKIDEALLKIRILDPQVHKAYTS
jgi:tetratricopeptide (TPR) repeat protein